MLLQLPPQTILLLLEPPSWNLVCGAGACTHQTCCVDTLDALDAATTASTDHPLVAASSSWNLVCGAGACTHQTCCVDTLDALDAATTASTDHPLVTGTSALELGLWSRSVYGLDTRVWAPDAVVESCSRERTWSNIKTAPMWHRRNYCCLCVVNAAKVVTRSEDLYFQPLQQTDTSHGAVWRGVTSHSSSGFCETF